jgi:hypothetical protein
MRIAPQVVLTSEQRAKLETYARGRSALGGAPQALSFPLHAH